MQEYAAHVMTVTLMSWVVYLSMVMQIRSVGARMMMFVVCIMFKAIAWGDRGLHIL